MTRNRLAAMLALLAVAAALYATSPRANQLVPYTTLPLDVDGDRVSLLVPQGWERLRSRYQSPNSSALKPPDRSPAWVKRIGFGISEMAFVKFAWHSTVGESGLADPTVAREHYHRDGGGESRWWVSEGIIAGSHEGCWVVMEYWRSDKTAFDATHAAIFRSARIIPGHAK